MTAEERRDILWAAHNNIGEERDPKTGMITVEGYRAEFNRVCASDPCFFINCCLWIFEPRENELMTEQWFLLRPKQEEYVYALVDAIRGGHDLLTVKTRTMGATWCVLAVFFWMWVFERNFTALIGTINRDKTDRKGDKSTLFSKLDYLAQTLTIDAPWLLPPAYESDQPYRTYMKMENPVNGSVITGEAPGIEFGRSGRYKAIFLDEFASWVFGSAAWTSCSETSPCHLPVSTPKGMGNMFARLAHPKSSIGATPKFYLSWEDDPTKNYWEDVAYDEEGKPLPPSVTRRIQPWLEYQRQKFSYDATMLAQEIFMDFNRSVEGQVYPVVSRIRLGQWDYNPDLPLYTSWDFGVRDFCAIIWIQHDIATGRRRIIDSLQFNGKSIFWYIPIITGMDLSLGDKEGGYPPDILRKIQRRSGWTYSDHYGDPAGKQRNPVTATSVISELRKHGISITTVEEDSWEEIRMRTTKLIPMLDVDERYNDDFVEAITNSAYPKPSDTSQAVSITNRPIHNEYSHLRTALEFYAINDRWYHKAQGEQKEQAKNEAGIGTVFGDSEKLRRFLQRRNGTSSGDFQGHRIPRGSGGY